MSKMTGSKETSTGTVTISVDVDFYVPRKGDTLHVYGTDIVLTEDMKPGVAVDYDGEKYVGSPLMTEETEPRLVFQGKGLIGSHSTGFTWRKGEAITRA